MNTKNNRRRRQSVEKIERVFIELLQTRELREITVSDICKRTKLNRSTFYANFLDTYDLADKVCEKLEEDFSELFKDRDEYDIEETGVLKMFTHIKDNQIFYKTYFKLARDEKHRIMIYDKTRAEKDFDNKHIKYHIEFFKSGINSVIKMWLAGGCEESPEEMVGIIEAEYRGR